MMKISYYEVHVGTKNNFAEALIGTFDLEKRAERRANRCMKEYLPNCIVE
ncbi:MAG: hypothetical protein ACOYL6_13095 [Bacteriovoracaceae bacterium]